MQYNMDAKTYKQNLLNELYAPYTKCLECPLGGLGRTRVVFGEGNPDAELVIIGEAPGQDEDTQGRPFVGRSGKLLTKILEDAGLPRDTIFITNIVKCRPPNNRKPMPIESSTCKNLLLIKQIQIIQPRLICTLGASALEGLTGQPVKITQMRGKPLNWRDIVVIPTYHPAYILRNPPELSTLQKDIKLVASLLAD